MNTTRSIHRILALLLTVSAVAFGLATSPDANALPFPSRTPANKLTARDAANDDELGRSVAISGNLAIVGASKEESAGGTDRGAAYVFNLSSGLQLLKLTASDAEDDDRFGRSVAISGNLAIVGAWSEDGAGGTDRGAAYVFDLNTGDELFKLVASDTEDDDYFGRSVAISGNLAIVGAWSEDGAGGNNRGAAYVFDLNNPNVPNPASPKQLHENRKLTASDAEDSDQFGVSVAISGNLAIVGANSEDGAGGNNRGAAYVFDLSTGDELFKLTASVTEDGDGFGISVAISGSLALVGAYTEGIVGAQRGVAYVFDLKNPNVSNPASPKQLHENRKLTASDAEYFDYFGQSVAISGNLAIVGAWSEDGAGGANANRGAAYVFDLSTGNELFKLTASDAEDTDQFGLSVAISGNLAIAGAFQENGVGGDNRGAAYVYEIPTYQPDNRIGPQPFTGPGDNTYNTTAAGQTLNLTSKKLRRLKAWLTVQNDGDRGDDYTLVASTGNRFFAVTYFRKIANKRFNITGAITAGTHTEPNVVPSEPGRLVCIEITPSRKLKKKKRGRKIILRKRFTTLLTTTSEMFAFKKDTGAVKAQTR